MLKTKQKIRREKLGPLSQKILLLLLAGVALGLTGSPIGYFKIIESVAVEWSKINKRALHNAIRRLYKSNLIDAKDNQDGSVTMILSGKGQKRALTYQIDEIQIPKMKKWDGNWRIVLFDIPEKHKKARDALSLTLKKIGFYKFQKSVFIHPFECQNEIDFVIEFFSLRQYVRYLTAHKIDNELDLKHRFRLN